MDSCKKNIPESNDMWYNAWKQTLYHSASGFRVHRENPGAQFSRRGTMSEGHGIMSVKQTLYHRASGFRVHRENPGAQFSRKKQYYANKKGAAMNQYVGQPFAALRYEKKILVVEETTSAGGCGSFNAASSCPASACLHDSAAWGFFIV